MIWFCSSIRTSLWTKQACRLRIAIPEESEDIFFPLPTFRQPVDWNGELFFRGHLLSTNPEDIGLILPSIPLSVQELGHFFVHNQPNIQSPFFIACSRIAEFSFKEIVSLQGKKIFLFQPISSLQNFLYSGFLIIEKPFCGNTP